MNALLQNMQYGGVSDAQSGSRCRKSSVRWPKVVHNTESIPHMNCFPVQRENILPKVRKAIQTARKDRQLGDNGKTSIYFSNLQYMAESAPKVLRKDSNKAAVGDIPRSTVTLNILLS